MTGAHRFILWLLAIRLAKVHSETTAWEKAKLSFQLGFQLVFGYSLLEEDEVEHIQGLRVIGAGFPRTGTKSTEQALRLMGHVVYDTRSVVRHDHGPSWVKAAIEYKKGNGTSSTSGLENLVRDIESLGYTATLDVPAHYLAVPISQIRPEAKVLLTVRDTHQQWLESYHYIYRAILQIHACRPWKWIAPSLSFISEVTEVLYQVQSVDVRYPEHLWRPVPWFEFVRSDFQPFDDQDMINAYNTHNEKVIRQLPPDRLLVFNVKQGWPPWVEFFHMQTPEVDFPHVNDRATLRLIRLVIRVVVIGLPVWIVGSLLLLSSLLRRVRSANKAKSD